ncbi:MAG: 2-C-methyl-D-erythritol 2,4-cyclodiphosphate synthase [Actinobacteria bacterium]|nr:2-C-methyl-D-erythritol 2,4-cyclodiphosphate synthase [Actinomycetota bacterium]
MRIGQGFDVHAFDDDRPLIIGGVPIPDHPGLLGHSDADVLCHAVADALLGAARLGDLGSVFPASDEWRDASSMDILRSVAGKFAAARFAIVNIDATVIAETPRLASYVTEMSLNVAEALGIDPEQVSVKATTTDGLGFTGRGEGIAAQAVSLIRGLG